MAETLTREQKLEQVKSKFIGTRQAVSLQVERAEMAVDEETRTVGEISFATDTPIEHWFGKLILEMSDKAVVMDRFKAGAPLLVCHDRRMQAGIIENGRIAGGKLRGMPRFSRSNFGEDIFQDVKDGIRTTSLGFVVHEMILEESDKTGDTYRATKWEPFEGSLEPIPADISCGVGRSLEATENPPIKNSETGAADASRNSNQPTIEVRTDMADENRENTPTVSPVVARAREIVEMGEVLGDVELAREMAADENATVASFRAALITKRKAAQGATTPPPVDPVAAGQRQGSGQQLARVISRHGKLKNFKGEGADERAYRFGMFLLAGPMGRNNDSPLVQRAKAFCRDNGIQLERTATESVNEDGGYNVPTEHGNDIIDLREEYGVFRPNTKVNPMASDSKTEPRREGGLTAYAVGETEAITESKKKWGQVKLAAKEWGVLAKTSSAHNEDTVINWADDTMGEIAYAIAQKEDECGFIGDGSGSYHGIRGVTTKLKGLSNTIANIAGLKVATGNLFSEFTLMDFHGTKALLPAYVYKRDKPKWYVHQTFWAAVMEPLVLAAGGADAAAIMNGAQPRFLGYPVEITQTMPSADADSQIAALFGSLRLASMLGDRKGLELAMTDSDGDDFASRILTLRGIVRFDVVVHDVGNASATASQRKPGPIVGLISKAS